MRLANFTTLTHRILCKLIAYILNDSIRVPQRYEKWKRYHTSVKGTAHKTLLVGRRTIDMPHVDGIDVAQVME